MTTDPRRYIPSSVSPEARAKLEIVQSFMAGLARPPTPVTLEEFDAAVARGEQFAAMITGPALAELASETRDLELGGVPVLEVLPQDYTDDGTALVYVHGGGFVQGSARSSLLTAALAAASSGRRVYSIDYTLSPRGTWRTILDQVVTVWTTLLEQRRAGSLGLFGDSAGACIAAAATLLMRERGHDLPAALVLLSPVTDLAGKGDTSVTLAHIDYFDDELRAAMRRAYVPDGDLSNPLVSPVFADFAPGYPPVLTQVGTREALLSDAVRLHRTLRAAGASSRLEGYEGMPHVFQSFFADTPEGRSAWAEIGDFWTAHLA